MHDVFRDSAYLAWGLFCAVSAVAVFVGRGLVRDFIDAMCARSESEHDLADSVRDLAAAQRGEPKPPKPAKNEKKRRS